MFMGVFNMWGRSFFVILSSAVVLSSCGGGGGGVSINGLSGLPDTSQMVSTSSTNSWQRMASSGTPPKLTEIGVSNESTAAANALRYFWNDDGGTPTSTTDIVTWLAAQAPGGGLVTTCGQFFEATAGSPGGEVACRMAQTTGYSFQPVIESGTSFCYMKNMPSAVGADNISPRLGNPEELFNQQSEDRVVKAIVTGQTGEDAGQDQTVFLKVHGRNSVGSNKYKVTLWFCGDGETSPNGYEELEVNRTTGAYSAVSAHGDNGNFTSELSAFLIAGENGTLSFDTTKDRVVQVQNSHDGVCSGNHKAHVTINSAGEIIVKSYHVNDCGGGDTFSDKNYAIANFTGTSIADLAFTEGAVKGSGTSTGGGGGSHEYRGATEFSGSYYASVTSGTKFETVNAYNFSSDDFYDSAPTTPTVDASSFSCAQEVQYTVTMDFSEEAVAEIKEDCEGKRLNNMNFCDSETVRDARETCHQSFGP